MTRAEYDSHAALTESLLKQIAAVQNGVARDRGCEFVTVGGTVYELIDEAILTSRTFFHSVAWFRRRRPSSPQVETASEAAMLYLT